MAISSIINTSLTGLFTNQEALRVTSNNIANVNTEGYARQTVTQTPFVVQGASVGVRIDEIRRVVDDFLEQALRSANSGTAEFQVQREAHDRLQGLLGRPDSGASLSARIDAVFTGMSELALNPADASVRQAVLSDLENYTSEVSRLAGSLQDLRDSANKQIDERIAVVNEAIRTISELNPLIVREGITGSDVGGLEDQRAQALAVLSENLDIRVLNEDDGSIQVVTGTGVQLIGRARYAELSYNVPGTVTAATQFSPIQVQSIDSINNSPIGTARDLDPDIQSGALRGLLVLRDDQLVDLSVSLGELAARVQDEFNQVHNSFTSVPAPNQLVGHATPLDAANVTGFSGIVTFAVVDADARLVAKTTVDFDTAPPANLGALITQVNTGLGGAGTLALTNGVMSLTASSSSNGVVIADDETTPSDRAGRGFSHFFGMNDLIEAQVPGLYETGLTGTDDHNLTGGGQTTFVVRDDNGRELAQYTYTVSGTTYNDVLTSLNGAGALGTYFTFSLDSNGALDTVIDPPYSNLKLDVVTDSTSHAGSSLTLSALFGIGRRYKADAASEMGLVVPVKGNVSRFAAAGFDQSALVSEVALSAGDQRGILAYQGLETRSVSFQEAGEIGAQMSTLSRYTGAFLGSAALIADRVTTAEANNDALQVEVQQRRSDVSGVNLDEELSNLVIYQNAYSAAARVLTSAQELFDSLLAAV